MKHSFFVSAIVAGILVAGGFLLFRSYGPGERIPSEEADPLPGETIWPAMLVADRGSPPSPAGSSIPGARGDQLEEESDGSSRRASRAIGSRALRTEADPSGKGKAVPDPSGAGSPGGVAGGQASAPAGPIQGAGQASAPAGPIQGAQLSEALAQALETQDAGAIQGLLVSSLTEKGTRFTADDLPNLFETLKTVDDYGIQKLLLTHLERMDAPPADLVSGYVDYLESAGRTAHTEEIINAIAGVGGDEALEGLVGLVRDASREQVVREAASALGRLKDERAVSALQDVLRDVGDPRRSMPFLSALASLGGERAISSLVDYASREGNEVAVSSLGGIRDREAGPILAEALAGRSSEAYKRAALRELRRYADPATLPYLERYLNQASEAMARETMGPLSRIRDPRAAAILMEYAGRHPDSPVGAQAAQHARRILAQLQGGEKRSR